MFRVHPLHYSDLLTRPYTQVHWPPIGIERGLVSDGQVRSQVAPPPQATEHSPVQVT